MIRKDWLTCPCCGYVTITTEHDICGVCGWQHDLVRESDPDSAFGANRMSLREAQRNFQSFGAKSRRSLSNGEKPGPDDVRDPDWRPVDQWDAAAWRRRYDAIMGRTGEPS